MTIGCLEGEVYCLPALDGAIVAIPWEASRVLAIDFGTRLPEDWPLSRLFNRY